MSGSGNVTKSSSQQITNQIQITNEIKIQQITLPKGTKGSDSSDNGDENGGGGGKVPSLRHIRVKANGRKFPENVPTIDLRGDSDEEVTVSSKISAMFPPIRKRKLDILREGGLEVTPIRSKDVGQPLKQPRLAQNQEQSVFRKVENIPKFQSKCMFTQSGKVFGNPKENVSQRMVSSVPSTSSATEVLDLTAKKPSGRSTQGQSGGMASIIPNFPALTNPNLMISFVPPTLPPNLGDTKALGYGNFLPQVLSDAPRLPGFGLSGSSSNAAAAHPQLNFPQLPPGLTIANLAELNANMNPYFLSYMYGSEGFLPPSQFFDGGAKNGK